MAEQDSEGKAKAFGLAPDRKALRARARPNPGALPLMLAKTRERLIDIEEWLAHGYTEGQVRERLRKHDKLSTSQADRLLKRAKGRWQTEATAAGREERRAKLRGTAWAGVRAALAREGLALDRDGGEHYYKNPDVGAAARLLEFLARLDGDLEQPAAILPEGFGEDARRALHLHFYGNMPPPTVEARVVEAQPEALPAGEGDGKHRP